MKNFFKALLKSQKHQKGFSLVEIMVAITIIAMIMGGVSVAFMTYLKKSRIKQAKIDITAISNSLDLYKTEFGKYPEGDNALEVLIKEKLLNGKKVPKDPWGNVYVYVYPSANGESEYDLYSWGPDAKEGGGDDISNTEKEEE